MEPKRDDTFYHCEIVIQAVAGSLIYEARTTAPPGAVLQSLNVAKMRFVKWLDDNDRGDDE